MNGDRLNGSRVSTKARSGGGSAQGKITRDDIAAKLREVIGGAQDSVEVGRSLGKVALVAGAGALVIGAYLLGRRRGRGRQAIIEIKRI